MTSSVSIQHLALAGGHAVLYALATFPTRVGFSANLRIVEDAQGQFRCTPIDKEEDAPGGGFIHQGFSFVTTRGESQWLVAHDTGSVSASFDGHVTSVGEGIPLEFYGGGRDDALIAVDTLREEGVVLSELHGDKRSPLPAVPAPAKTVIALYRDGRGRVWAIATADAPSTRYLLKFADGAWFFVAVPSAFDGSMFETAGPDSFWIFGRHWILDKGDEMQSFDAPFAVLDAYPIGDRTWIVGGTGGSLAQISLK